MEASQHILWIVFVQQLVPDTFRLNKMNVVPLSYPCFIVQSLKL